MVTEIGNSAKSHMRPAGIFRSLLKQKVAVASDVRNMTKSVKSRARIPGRFRQ